MSCPIHANITLVALAGDPPSCFALFPNDGDVNLRRVCSDATFCRPGKWSDRPTFSGLRAGCLLNRQRHACACGWARSLRPSVRTSCGRHRRELREHVDEMLKEASKFRPV